MHGDEEQMVSQTLKSSNYKITKENYKTKNYKRELQIVHQITKGNYNKQMNTQTNQSATSVRVPCSSQLRIVTYEYKEHNPKSKQQYSHLQSIQNKSKHKSMHYLVTINKKSQNTNRCTYKYKKYK